MDRVRAKTQAEMLLDMLPDASTLVGVDDETLVRFTPDVLARAIEALPQSVTRMLRRFRGKGEAHVHTWVKRPGQASVWVRGPGEDAEKTRMTQDERAAYQREYNKTWRRLNRGQHLGDEGSDCDISITPPREKARTQATIRRAQLVPRSWMSTLEDIGEPQE